MKWTKEQLDILTKLYPNHTNIEISIFFNTKENNIF